MFRSKLTFLTMALGLLGFAGSSLATNLTSNNAANVVASTSGTTVGAYQSWAQTLTTSPYDSPLTGSTWAGTQGLDLNVADNGLFTFSGTNGFAGNTIQTNTSYPLTISMPVTPGLTGLELALSGVMSVTLTLADGSTVTTGTVNYASQTYVTFDSPLEFTWATIVSTTPGVISDLSWGTVIPADLPTQPSGGGPSNTPEGLTFLLVGGGLLFMSRWAKRHSFSF